MLLDLSLAALLLPVIFAGIATYRHWDNLREWAGKINSYFLPPGRPSGGILLPLFFVSVSSLYLEIMLIRWVGTEVRIFAYFQNLALIACFLGFGLGCYFSKRRINILFSLTAVTALVALVKAPLNLWQIILTMTSSLLSGSPDAVMWGGVLPELRTDTIVLASIVAIVAVGLFLTLAILAMIPVGQWVGYFLDSAPQPLTAYSVNLLGSLVGIWLFAVQSYFWLPPSGWLATAFILLVLFPRSSWRMKLAVVVLFGAALGLLAAGGGAQAGTFWSPYQKIEVDSHGDQQYVLKVNSTNYMSIANGTPAYMAKHPQLAAVFEQVSSYDAPYRFAAHAADVLIVGAGAGNDAAAALRHRALSVDAVEIDPVILHLGMVLHPEQPYSSSGVHPILTDARAFLRGSKRNYDMIIFGLLDSHTEFSDFSNVRIDNYVYTEESLLEARRLLKPEGILVVKFEVRPPWTWIGQRLYAMLEEVFGRPPVVFYAKPIGGYNSASVFITSNDPDLWRRAKEPLLASLVQTNPPPFPVLLEGSPPLTTDDWPYLYHRSHSVPRTYWTVSLILLIVAFLFARPAFQPRSPGTWHFFCLGAGFLLLETQMVSRLALYFGTTWIVNCIALSAILMVLVGANLWVLWLRPQKLTVYYALLIVSLLANYATPWELFPWGVRTVGILLTGAFGVSVFLAGVIFAGVFNLAPQRSTALGSNLVGAVVGGLAGNFSFIAGLKTLLMIAAVFYGAAAVFGRLDRDGEAETELER